MFIRMPVGSSQEDKEKFIEKMGELLPEMTKPKSITLWTRYKTHGIAQVVYELPLGLEVAYMKLSSNINDPYNMSQQYWEFNGDYVSKMPNMMNLSREEFNELQEQSIGIATKEPTTIESNLPLLNKLEPIFEKIIQSGYNSLNSKELDIINKAKKL